MFNLNPLANPDAFWQHILMLVVAAILGYIIGYISGSRVITELENELSSLDSNLNFCLEQKSIIKKSNDQIHALRNMSQPVSYDTIQESDLKIIEGIGPVIETVLKNAGISSFHQLSKKTPAQILLILIDADPRYQIHDPETWPHQAELAANGKWDQLKAWQDELNGGRV
jgi:predicted flap endonuclease-1-like 5' DNA nuclease